jgi:hypothetical protein
LFTVDAPPSSASSISSAEGLAPANGQSCPFDCEKQTAHTDIDIALLDHGHFAIDFIGNTIDFFPG